MPDLSPLSPEERRRSSRDDKVSGADAASDLPLGTHWQQAKDVAERIGIGVYSNGFTFSGNFAYLSLLAVFSFFIVAAAVAGSFGTTQTGAEIVNGFLRTVPPSVASALRGPISDAMTARTGPLLWFSAAVGLWTTASLIETIREILQRAYGVTANRPFWEYRLGSIGLVIASVILAMVALSAQFLVAGVGEVVHILFPNVQTTAFWLSISRVLPFLILFVTLYILFRSLTPRIYRSSRYPKWPGAVFISFWWLAITGLLPVFIKYAANYELTYGSLAGVMITLIFFYLVGLGMVIGAQLNAALAERNDGIE